VYQSKKRYEGQKNSLLPSHWCLDGYYAIFHLQIFFQFETISGFFVKMGYPTYLIYPLAITKILDLIAICGNFSKWLKEWAYAGFFFDIVLAFFAHYMISDGQHLFSAVAFFSVLTSYFFGKEVRP